MAKLLKLRRGTTTQHGSFTGAEGEVTVDTDKETLVVHDGSTAGGHPVAAEDMANVSSASIAGRLATDSIAPAKIGAGTLPTDVTVASANIVDGTIVNADVNASAAVAGTKIAPNFGSQDVTTTGNFGAASVNITDNSPSLIFTDSAANSDFRIRAQSGVLKLRDDTNSADRLTIASNGTTTVAQNLDVGAGVDVTGNITATGTLNTGAATLDSVNCTVVTDGSTNNGCFINAGDTGAGNRPDIVLKGAGSAGLGQKALEIYYNNGSNLAFDINYQGDVSARHADFSAGIDVTGQITSTGALTITNEAPAIALVDSGQNPDWEVVNNNGTFVIKDSTNNASKFYIESDGHTNIVGNLDAEGGVDVTGNITVSGTVDGVDIAALNASALKKDGTNNGASTVRCNDADFIVQDGTDGTTNFVWRDHSASKLYLGTDAAVVTPRSHVIPSADSTFNIGSSSVRFANGYFDTLYGDGSNLTGVQPFPSGTKMLFQQTSAPTGWTKVTSSVDNKALRVVSGSVSSGGNQAFTSAFASRTPAGNVGASGNSTASFSGSVSGNTGNSGANTGNTAAGGNVNNHTLSSNQMPSHSHSITGNNQDSYGSWRTRLYHGNSSSSTRTHNTNNTGGGGSHSHGFSGSNHSHNVNNHTHSFSGNFSGNTGNHTHNAGSFSGSAMDFAVQYLDVIICSKD
tara:strand:+ start:3172 stop:5229 length:2058 start_codon:yes stop_codon:yes gene_type:complete